MGKISSASLFATFAAAAAEEEEDAGTTTYKEHFVLLDDKMCVGKQIPAPLLPPRSPASQEVQAAVLQASPIRKEKLFLESLVCLYGRIIFPAISVLRLQLGSLPATNSPGSQYCIATKLTSGKRDNNSLLFFLFLSLFQQIQLSNLPQRH